MAIQSPSGSEPAQSSPESKAGPQTFDPSCIRRLVRAYFLLDGDRNESFLGLVRLSMAFSHRLFIQDEWKLEDLPIHSAKADVTVLALSTELNKYNDLDRPAIIQAIEDGKFDYILMRVRSRILSEIKARQRRPRVVDIPPEDAIKYDQTGPPPEPPQDHDDDCNWQGASMLLENAGYYIEASDPEAADILYALATDAYERYERFIERQDARLTRSLQKGK